MGGNTYSKGQGVTILVAKETPVADFECSLCPPGNRHDASIHPRAAKVLRCVKHYTGPHRPEAGEKTTPVIDGYESLRSVLAEAVTQASDGKGRERHAGEGENFEDQQIVQLNQWMGSTHGNVFQACKKALESTRLPTDRARRELLGAINYLAAAVIVLDKIAK